MESTKDIEKLIEYIKRCNWWVQEEEVNEDYTILLIGKYSPAGQDFSITVEAEENSVDSFLYNLLEQTGCAYISERTSCTANRKIHGS